MTFFSSFPEKPPLLHREFYLFLAYNLVFLLLQIALVLIKSVDFVHALPLPVSVYFEFIVTLLIHISLYALLALLQTFFLWGIIQLSCVKKTRDNYHSFIWLVSIAAVVFSNAYFFPSSLLTQTFFRQIPIHALMLLMYGSCLVLCVFMFISLIFMCGRFPKKMGSLFVITLCFYFGSTHIPIAEKKASKLADIILIGIDSLDPNYISKKYTPNLQLFINNGVLFQNTISPLARTYPAWTSILTGLYPHHHHANYNLMPSDLVKSSLSMAWSLKKTGYQTIFASDDRRFNNMGKEFGFQTVVGPKIGINDFLLGTFNDFPLSNLLANLPLSRWLFPYNYLNRASYFTYYPQSFDDKLQKIIASNPHQKPVFLAVHFTLPHYPYGWGASAQKADKESPESNIARYKMAITRADQQVGDLLTTLGQKGYLKNSMVVLLTDHGEAFQLPGSRQTTMSHYQGQKPSAFADYIQKKTDTTLNTTGGHGSDLLSPEQFRCLLAFKQYQHNHLITKPKILKTQVALIDIMPTIHELIELPITTTAIDGISLLESIRQENTEPPARRFIMESGMLPNQAFLKPGRLKEIGRLFYKVNTKNSKLQLRDEKLAALDALKLYAIIDEKWELALYPDDKGYIPVILNRANGKWTDSFQSDFAHQSPALSMLKELQTFYRKQGQVSEPFVLGLDRK